MFHFDFDDRYLKELLSQTRGAAQALEGKTLEQEFSEAVLQWQAKNSLETLLSLGAQGDRTALDRAVEEIERRYSRDLFNYIKMKIRTEEEARDVVQDIYVEVYKSARRYDQVKGEVGAWLFGIARNLVLRWKVQSQRSRIVLVEDPLEETGPDQLSTTLDLENLEQEEISDIVQEALREAPLSDREQDVIYCLYMQGFSYEQVAELVGLPARQNVTYHRRTAFSKLLRWFDSRGLTPRDLIERR